ncbi:zincin, partial [Ramicandelaber brevisporus]
PLSPAVGLFCNPNFTSAEALDAAGDRTIQGAQQLVSTILEHGSPNSPPHLRRGVIKLFDQLSDHLCQLLDPLELLRTAHPDPYFREAANDTYAKVFKYMAELNIHAGLFDALNRLVKDPVLGKQLSYSESYVARSFLRDFERNGIHLNKTGREQVVALTEELHDLGRHALQIPDVHPAFNTLRPLGAKRRQYQRRTLSVGLSQMLGKFDPERPLCEVPVTPQTIQYMLSSAQDESVRAAAFTALNTAGNSDAYKFERLLEARGELASLVGRESFAAMMLEDKMAANPENVERFLTGLATRLQQRTARELESLRSLKVKRANDVNAVLHPWDRDHFMRLIPTPRQATPSSSESSSSSSSVVVNGPRPASLGSVLATLSVLFFRLYGITLRPVEPAPGEVWANDVCKVNVVDCEDSNRHLGTVYFDLFSRPGKPSLQAAHFAIRCARRTDNDIQSSTASNGLGYNDNVDGKQRPIVALVCDFTRPAAETGLGGVYLHAHEVETLFHEMGHALHSMLGQTEFQNVAGTRCVQDFVELPSVLMEWFARDPQIHAVMHAFDNNTAFGDDIERIIGFLDEGGRPFAALEAMGQISMAMVDQVLHNERISSSQNRSLRWSSRLVNTLQGTAPFNVYPHGLGTPAVSGYPPTDWHILRFQHLITYSAGYYSYLLARVLAGRVWMSLFANGRSLSRSGGDMFRSSVLRWGGGRDPWHCVSECL